MPRPTLALICSIAITRAALSLAAPATEPIFPTDPDQPKSDIRSLPTYEDYAPPGSYLVGIDTSAVRQTDDKMFFNSLRPLYFNPDDPNAPEPLSGKPFLGNARPGHHTVTVAKPGYAVAAIIYHQSNTIIDGYRLIFDRVAGDHLDTADSYPGRWIGTKGKIVADSQGSLVLGLRSAVGVDLHTFTLLTEPPADAPASPAASTRPTTAKSYAYHEPNPAKAPFHPANLKLPPDVRAHLATALATYAAAHDPNDATPKFLGLALLLDPDNRAAVLANASLKRGSFHPTTRPASQPDDTAAATPVKDLLDAAKLAKSANTPADLALASCLYDLILTLQPAQEDALYESELLRRSNHPAEWAWAVGGPARDPNASPNPDFASTPKPFAKVQTSIKGLAVITDSAGQHFGEVLEMILTVSPPAGHGTDVQLAGTTGPEMRTARDEAVRTIKVRYPAWERKQLIISFDDKYSPKDGGSAGTAFALLLLSSLEGWDIDTHFAVTGDITVDGKVRGIGGVEAKVRGAAADHCTLVSVPSENADRIADYLVLTAPKSLAEIQIFSSATLTDAANLARTNRPVPLARAIDTFAEFQSAYQSAKNPATYLASPEAREKLAAVLDLAPNHLSAKYLLLCNEGKQPKKLSIAMSLYRMALAVNHFAENIKDSRKLTSQPPPDSAFTEALRQLRLLRPITADETTATLTTLTDFVDGLQRYNRHALSLPEVNRRLNAWQSALSKLEADPNIMTKLLRDGV